MTRGEKSCAVRLHNAGWGLDEISKHMRIAHSDVLAYLASREGYPGKIINAASGRYARIIRARVERKDHHRHVPAVTLPKLKFLEDTQ